jgi:hypothetical protein
MMRTRPTIGARLRAVRRTATLAAVALAMAGTTACLGTDDDDDEPEVASMRLTVGGTTRNITGAAGENRTFTVTGTAPVAVSAEFLLANGQVEMRAMTNDFRLLVTPTTGSGVVWTAAAGNNFAGTLAVPASVTGTTTIQVSLLHISSGHSDYGPFTITLSR